MGVVGVATAVTVVTVVVGSEGAAEASWKSCGLELEEATMLIGRKVGSRGSGIVAGEGGGGLVGGGGGEPERGAKGTSWTGIWDGGTGMVGRRARGCGVGWREGQVDLHQHSMWPETPQRRHLTGS